MSTSPHYKVLQKGVLVQNWVQALLGSGIAQRGSSSFGDEGRTVTPDFKNRLLSVKNQVIYSYSG